MFPYDPQLFTIFSSPAQTIPQLVAALAQVDGICDDGDGVKWFNRLYLQVTRVVQARVDAGGFLDPDWLRQLDLQFGQLYFSAMSALLQGSPCPDCWRFPVAQSGARYADRTGQERVPCPLVG